MRRVIVAFLMFIPASLLMVGITPGAASATPGFGCTYGDIDQFRARMQNHYSYLDQNRNKPAWNARYGSVMNDFNTIVSCETNQSARNNYLQDRANYSNNAQAHIRGQALAALASAQQHAKQVRDAMEHTDCVLAGGRNC